MLRLWKQVWSAQSQFVCELYFSFFFFFGCFSVLLRFSLSSLPKTGIRANILIMEGVEVVLHHSFRGSYSWGHFFLPFEDEVDHIVKKHENLDEGRICYVKDPFIKKEVFEIWRVSLSFLRLNIFSFLSVLLDRAVLFHERVWIFLHKNCNCGVFSFPRE